MTDVKASFPVNDSTTSFWRTELSDIDEYQSSAMLPKECDVLIIGAGLSGASTAYHILEPQSSKLHSSVTLLEARQVCSRASGRNGGHCKLQWPYIAEIASRFGVKAAAELAELHLSQIHALKRVVDAENIECDFNLRRSFNVYFDEKEFNEVQEAYFALRDCIPASSHVDFISERHVEQLTGVNGAKGALSAPACSLWPYKLACGLLKIALKKGLNLYTNTYVTNVTNVQSTGGYYSVYTSRGPMKARKILFATNAYTSSILPEFRHVIIPCKGTASRTVCAETATRNKPNLLNTYNIKFAPNHIDYINPRPDGSIIVGGGDDSYPRNVKTCYNNWDDSSLTASQNYFQDYMRTTFSAYGDTKTSLDMIWTGIMGFTPDGLPLIGPIPKRPNTFIMGGFNGKGMGYIFLCSKAMALMIRDNLTFGQTSLPRMVEATSKRLRATHKDPTLEQGQDAITQKLTPEAML